MTTTATIDTGRMQVGARLYRTLWRWHFYAGLCCIPFILLLAVTGTLYLFKPQIDAAINDRYQVVAVGERATAQAQIDAALAAHGGTTFASYQLPSSDIQAVIISLHGKAGNLLVHINPYSLEVLNATYQQDQILHWVKRLHGELALGNAGSVVVELAGCWSIVLLITGLYLWWPRNAQGLAGVIYPRMRARGKVFWRDLHAVTGFWVALFTLFLLISGLPWALVWGSAFKEIRAIGQPPIQQNWRVSSNEHEDHAHHAPVALLPRPLSQTLLSNAQALRLAAPAELSLDRNNPGQWQLSSQHQNRTLRQTVWFDGASGALVKTQSFVDRSALDRIIGIGISAHEGQLFGWFNQLLGLFTTMGLCLVSISGFILWRKRKPDGVLGAPPRIPNMRVSKTVFLITLALAAVLPVLLISLLVLLLLEYLIIRRIGPAQRWLGLV